MPGLGVTVVGVVGSGWGNLNITACGWTDVRLKTRRSSGTCHNRRAHLEVGGCVGCPAVLVGFTHCSNCMVAGLIGDHSLDHLLGLLFTLLVLVVGLVVVLRDNRLLVFVLHTVTDVVGPVDCLQGDHFLGTLLATRVLVVGLVVGLRGDRLLALLVDAIPQVVGLAVEFRGNRLLESPVVSVPNVVLDVLNESWSRSSG